MRLNWDEVERGCDKARLAGDKIENILLCMVIFIANVGGMYK